MMNKKASGQKRIPPGTPVQASCFPILDECKKRKITNFLLCIDFSKAFDSVWIKGLIVKLRDYLVHGKILKVINNFLLSRKVQLRVNSVLGNRRACGWFGLPQKMRP